MAYGKIYTTNWFKDKYGNDFKLFISKKNYTGATTNFQLLEGYSLNHSFKGGRDVEYLAVHGSALDFSIWSQPQTQLLKDNYFDNNFNAWKQAGYGSLSWYYNNGLMTLEADGGDFSDNIYQDILIKNGVKYKVVVDFTMDDTNTNHELYVNFFNNTSNPYSGNQLYPFNTDNDTFDGVETFTITANSNYTKVGLSMYAGGATAVIRSIKLYELGTDYSALMEADYNEYKTTLIQNRQVIDNPTFTERPNNYTFDNWSNVYDGSGTFSWEYNTTFKTLAVTSDGLSWSDILHQDEPFIKGQTYKVKIHFAVDNNWNQSKLRLTRYEDPLYDPPTHIILLSGSSGLSYTNPNVSIVDSESSNIIPFGMEYWIEYTFTPTYPNSAIGFSFSSGDEACYIFSFEVETEENVFIGWVKPDNITKRFLNEQYYININSIDGIADLKNFEFFVQPTYTSMISTLESALNLTGLNLPFMIQNNIFHDTVDAYPWYDCQVDNRRWIQDKRGKKTYSSAYSVIEDILTPFNAQLRQVNGRWLIQNHGENNTRRIIYQTGTTYYAGTINRTIDITDFKYVPDSDEVSKIAPAKGINVTVDNVQYDDSFITNGRFDLNLDGWTRHDTSWPTFQRISADGDAYLRCRTTSNSSFTEYSFSGMTYLPNPSNSIGADRDSFSVNLDLLIASQPATVANRPWLRIYAIRYGAIGEMRSIRLNNLTTNEWHNVTAEFGIFTDMRDDFPDDMKIDISLFFSGSTGNAYEIYFDNIKLEYEFAKDVDDKTQYYLELDSTNPLLQVYKEELKFGDGYYTNDIAVILLPNDKRTTLWRNWDFSITGKTLVELYGREKLRQNAVYKDYIRCSVFDESFKISPNSLVKLFNKTYKIVGYKRNFLLAQVDLELIEYKFTDIGSVTDFYYPSFTAFDY